MASHPVEAVATIGRGMTDGGRSERLRYNLDEANALVPQLRAVLLQLAVEKRRFDAALGVLHALHGGDGANGGGNARSRPHAESDQREAELTEIGEGIKSLLAHLEGMGVEVRDLDEGLVDIPTERDGEPVWFCWRLSDTSVGFWHSTREGFANRKPW
jgi:hypothetical protein